MKKYPIFEIGYKLREDEYVLKIRESDNAGFLSKLKKDGSLMKSFDDWPNEYGTSHKSTVYLFKEEFRSGWKLKKWRFGESQNWATLMHPEGFTLEVYLGDFLKILLENTMSNGEIQGNFKWEEKRLIRK